MTIDHAHLRPVGAALSTQRTIMLTGASGVLGQALLPRLARHDVVCLTHHRPVANASVRSVRGDLTRRELGMRRADYRALAGSIDAIIHCAAVTEFNRDDGSVEATNVDGTRRVLDLAAAAEAPVIHVSTAFVNARGDADRPAVSESGAPAQVGGSPAGRTALRYATSKRAAEQVVRDSRLPHVIVRPSIIVGDSRSGRIAAFQGIYRVIGALLRGRLPILPFAAHWRIDFVPQDVVADAVATVVERAVVGEELWLTAGPRALTLQESVETCRTFAGALDLDVPPPRYVPPELFDRLIAPVFLPALPPKVHNTVTRLLEVFAAYTAQEEPFPSSMDDLSARFGVAPVPDPRTALLVALRHWAATVGLAEPRLRSEVV